MKLSKTIAIIVVVLSFGVIVHASPLGRTYTLFSIQGFTNHLIDMGIIPQTLAEKARELAYLVSKKPVISETPTVLNADKVSVSVSQVITHANLEFAEGDDIKGILLVVRNTSDARVDLEAKRRCQVVYRIYDAEEHLVYESTTREVCKNAERVTYSLDSQQARMFQIVHHQTEYALKKGVYRFEVEYPGYGKGDRTVTVQ